MKGLSLPPDLLLLKRPLLVVMLCLLASGVWYAGIYRFQRVNICSVQADQMERDALESKIRRLEGEERAIRGHIDGYRRLQARGVIGEERRLELVEALGRIRDRHNLYPLQFDIEQQKFFPPRENGGEELPLNEGGGDGLGSADEDGSGAVMVLGASRMKISLPLLHEEDLTRLLEDLRGLDQGLFVVEQCEIDRLAGGRAAGEPALVQENLSAVCQILWLTLKLEDWKPGDREAEQ